MQDKSNLQILLHYEKKFHICVVLQQNGNCYSTVLTRLEKVELNYVIYTGTNHDNYSIVSI